ncbi:MAG TPA: prolyl oligopeptidase family serine peptidase [Roseiflexaceae bacterium]|nr:prolyl oligopeptidase family serine peptidase [Roseiflexaceae bacterium]
MSDTSRPAYPATPRHTVTDQYHGVEVAEEYRWLEDAEDPAVREWNAAQNSLTRAYLDSIPVRERLFERVQDILSQASSDYFALQLRDGKLFAVKQQPPKAQPLLVILASPDQPDSERVVLDPNALDPSGATTIDFYEPSLDGNLVAVSLSKNGSEDGTLHIYDVATGQELGDVVPRVTYPTGGGSVAWNGDTSGLFYTRYPYPGERTPEDLNFYQQIYYHKLGTPAGDDVYVLGEDFPRIAEIELQSSNDGSFLLATVANGDGGEFAHYLRGPDGNWTQITHFEDQIKRGQIGHDNALYLQSHNGAPNGKVLRIPLETPDLDHADVVVPERDTAVRGFVATDTRLYVAELAGGPSQVRVYNLRGGEQGLLPSEPVTGVAQIAPLEGDAILFRSTSFVRPPAWYRFDPAEEEPAQTPLAATSPADFSEVEVLRAVATSKDGTRVPLTILHHKNITLDGNNPTLLAGYGGYGLSISPAFNPARSVWLEQGGVLAVANLRGGGEFGEAWHLAGNLLKKQNVFDDMIGCAEYLIAEGYTNPGRLAIMGGSNGGLLMGALLTQRPELFRAVVSSVGIYDMLRVELDPNGAFNVPEFGSVKDAAQFAALYAYSPYHRVVDGVAYPAVLFVAGENDGRVNPAHSRKMTARLQAATASERPVLLRTSASSGHGQGTSLRERIAEDTDVFTFLFDQLQMPYAPPGGQANRAND